MRDFLDRFRHAIGYEVFGLILSVPLFSYLFDQNHLDFGYLTIMMAIIAMFWNYIFNFLFDHALVKLGRKVYDRPYWLRILHACLFEFLLMIITTPFVSWWLDVTLMKAFMIDIGMVFFYLTLAYAYNWGYDKLFPMPAELELKSKM